MSNRPAGSIRVVVPNESSIITSASGEPHMVEVEADGTRVVYLLPDDARRLICSGLPSSLPWREANTLLAEALGPMPKVEPGIHIASHLQALERMRPLHPRDIKGTLRELGVLR